MDWSYWWPRLIEGAGTSVKLLAFIWFCFFVFDIPLLLALFGDHLQVFFAIVVGAALMGGMLWLCGELLKRKGALSKGRRALGHEQGRVGKAHPEPSPGRYGHPEDRPWAWVRFRDKRKRVRVE
jgi:hypothetical protein